MFCISKVISNIYTYLNSIISKKLEFINRIKKILNLIFYIFMLLILYLFALILLYKFKFIYTYFIIVNFTLTILEFFFEILRTLTLISSLFSSLIYSPTIVGFLDYFITPNFFSLTLEQLDLIIKSIKENKFFSYIFSEIKKSIKTISYRFLIQSFKRVYLSFYKKTIGFSMASDKIFSKEDNFILFCNRFLLFSDKFMRVPSI